MPHHTTNRWRSLLPALLFGFFGLALASCGEPAEADGLAVARQPVASDDTELFAPNSVLVSLGLGYSY